jgi:xanthine/CO dehydrogenase XdhC/CoxF family maturation factor
VAHGAPAPADPKTLVAVFASPVAAYLLHFAHDLGYRAILVEPDEARRAGDGVAARFTGVNAAFGDVGPSFVDGTADVVITDHDRPELGTVLRDALALPARWIGVMGSPRHTAPHVAALRGLGVAEDDIARVHRPIGLNIGSHTPAEIAVATLAGLIADRNDRPGGFTW